MKKLLITAVVAGAMTFAPSTSAQTVQELQAMIQALMAQIAAMQGGQTTTTSTYVNPGVTLRVGSQGTAVAALQSTLNSLGFAVGSADGKFGLMTGNGVRAFQASKGLAADGVAGNMTHNALVAATATTTTIPEPGQGGGSGTLEGEGELTVSTYTGSDSSIDEGSEGSVYELRMEAEDGDVRLDRVDFHFTKAGLGDNNPWQVFVNASLEVNGREIASLRTDRRDDWTRNGSDYRLRFSGINFIIEEGDEVDVELVLETANVVRDAGSVSWDIEAGSYRASDASGVVITETISGAVTATVDVELVGSDADFRIRASQDNPSASTLIVDDSSQSDEHTVLIAELEARKQDVRVETLVFGLEIEAEDDGTPAPADKFYDAVVDRAELDFGGRTYRPETVVYYTDGTFGTTVGAPSAFAQLTFDVEGRVTIRSGRSEDAELNLTFRAANGTNYVAGAQVTATMLSKKAMIETTSGNSIDVSSLNNVAGEEHTLLIEGVFAERTGENYTPLNAGDEVDGTISITFDLTAVGEDATLADDGSDFDIDDSTFTPGDVILTSSNLNKTGTNFILREGQTRRFTLSVKVPHDTTGFVQLKVTDIDGSPVQLETQAY